MDVSAPTSFFSPNSRTESIVTEASIDEDAFHRRRPQDEMLVEIFGKTRELRESLYNTGRFEALVEAYLDYADSQEKKCGSSSHNIMNGGPERGQLGSIYRGPKLASVVTAIGFTGSCHRVLVMQSSNNVQQNDNITVSELELLVSWMYGSMSAQTYALCRDGVRASKYHMIFPVVAISFLMPTHARVIQCYFDEGKLNVQSTPLYDFDVDRSEYFRFMDDFLKWIVPIPTGNTTLAERFRKPPVATAQGDESITHKFTTRGPSLGPPLPGLTVRSAPAAHGSPSDENAPPS
ncbi:hypothetical protein CNMCM5878_007623 [Aspergillus fumigatiaffinis]|nr:hypothetical protein CNMCM5878_007623 [Aspergillus fumigatiaffinis]